MFCGPKYNFATFINWLADNVLAVFKFPKCINVSFGRIVLVMYRLLVQPDYIRKYIVEKFF